MYNWKLSYLFINPKCKIVFLLFFGSHEWKGLVCNLDSSHFLCTLPFRHPCAYIYSWTSVIRPPVTRISLLMLSSCDLAVYTIILSIFHSFPYKILLKTKNKWMNFSFISFYMSILYNMYTPYWTVISIFNPNPIRLGYFGGWKVHWGGGL